MAFSRSTAVEPNPVSSMRLDLHQPRTPQLQPVSEVEHGMAFAQQGECLRR